MRPSPTGMKCTPSAREGMLDDRERHRSAARAISGPCLVACLLAFLAAPQLAPAQRPDDWAVPEATVRFAVRLTEAPTHREAGYFINLPDGGILPGPAPVTTVLPAAGGDELESRLLWHNSGSGMSVVFAAPAFAADRAAAL